MWNKKIILWFMSNSEGGTRQVSIPRYLLWVAPTAIFLLVIVLFLLLSQLFGDRVNRMELERLRAENNQLAEKFDNLRSSLADVDARFTELIQKEIAIRNLFNLPEINPVNRQLGTGGPAMFASLTPSEEVASETEAEVDRLIKLSEFELQKLSEVEGALTNLRDRLDRTPSILPAEGWMSRGYGMHFDPFTGVQQMHRGVDIANKTGTPIIAPAKGKVIYAGYDKGGLGNLVVIEHGAGFSTRHGHMSKVLVKRGEIVDRGALIGLMGSTGYSTGPHLHYEVWRNGKALNPSEYILNN